MMPIPTLSGVQSGRHEASLTAFFAALRRSRTAWVQSGPSWRVPTDLRREGRVAGVARMA